MQGPSDADATAVVLNLTGVAPTLGTLLRAYPTPVSGNAVPTVSNLNQNGGTVVANLAIVPVGAGGQVRLRNENGSVDVIADVAGYFSATATTSFVPARWVPQMGDAEEVLLDRRG